MFLPIRSIYRVVKNDHFSVLFWTFLFTISHCDGIFAPKGEAPYGRLVATWPSFYIFFIVPGLLDFLNRLQNQLFKIINFFLYLCNFRANHTIMLQMIRIKKFHLIYARIIRHSNTYMAVVIIAQFTIKVGQFFYVRFF
jgi:hypothetical protein